MLWLNIPPDQFNFLKNEFNGISFFLGKVLFMLTLDLKFIFAKSPQKNFPRLWIP